MDGFDPDRELERLRSAAERIGANLLELDQDPTRALLDAAALGGDSATRWERARTALAALFQSYAELTAVLDRAATVRAAAARSAHLAKPSWPHCSWAHPSRCPTPWSRWPSATCCPDRGRSCAARPTRLLSRMSDSFAAVRAVVAAAARSGRIWCPGCGRAANGWPS